MYILLQNLMIVKMMYWWSFGFNIWWIYGGMLSEEWYAVGFVTVVFM